MARSRETRYESVHITVRPKRGERYPFSRSVQMNDLANQLNAERIAAVAARCGTKYENRGRVDCHSTLEGRTRELVRGITFKVTDLARLYA